MLTDAQKEKKYAQAREWRKNNPERVRAYNREWRKANPEKKRAIDKKSRLKHIDKARASSRKWQKDNPDKANANSRKYRKSNPDKARSRSREYRNANLEKYRASVSKWGRAHPEYWRAKSRKRRALKNGQTEHFNNLEWQMLCEQYNNRCLRCGEKKVLTPDHIVPLTSGGKDTIDNIQPLCFSCNSSKGARYIVDYRNREPVKVSQLSFNFSS